MDSEPIGPDPIDTVTFFSSSFATSSHTTRSLLLDERFPTVPVCVEEPQTLEVDPPTSSPTDNPTASPTKNPTSSPTKAPTSSPTKNPTAAPTEDVVYNAPPYVGSCPSFTESFDDQVCDTFMQESALWFTSGISSVVAVGGNTPNAVSILEFHPLTSCSGIGHDDCLTSNSSFLVHRMVSTLLKVALPRLSVMAVTINSLWMVLDQAPSLSPSLSLPM